MILSTFHIFNYDYKTVLDKLYHVNNIRLLTKECYINVSGNDVKDIDDSCILPNLGFFTNEPDPEELSDMLRIAYVNEHSFFVLDQSKFSDAFNSSDKPDFQHCLNVIETIDLAQSSKTFKEYITSVKILNG